MEKCSLSCFLVFIIFSCVHGQTTTNYGTYSGTGGVNNGFYGFNSGGTTTGNFNSFFGAYSGYFNTSGQGNTFIGNNAGAENWAGNYNTYIGRSSGSLAGAASYNSAVGANTGLENYGGSYNVFFGANSGYNNETGSYNTCLGVNSGYNTGNGSRNVFLGSYAGYNETGSDKLYIDNSNTSSPLIYGDFLSNKLTVNGNLGVGTTNPVDKFQIGNAIAIHDGGHEVIGFNHAPTGSTDLDVNRYAAEIRFDGEIGNFILGTSSTVTSAPSSRLVINKDGDIGIGTTDTKGFKLGVQGDIAAEEVKVQLYANWPDFVFESNYNLPALLEVEQHIKDKGHLKDIPSAKEVAENGIFLGDMNAKLLKKIEELMLYTIEQEKKIEFQKVQLENHSEINKTLENRLLKLEQLLYKNVNSNETKGK